MKAKFPEGLTVRDEIIDDAEVYLRGGISAIDGRACIGFDLAELEFTMSDAGRKAITRQKAHQAAVALPHYKVDDACRHFAAMSRQTACHVKEQNDYDELKTTLWPAISDDIKIKCIAETDKIHTSVVTPYAYLKDCVSSSTPFHY